jgi:transcriptional regulator PpsR
MKAVPRLGPAKNSTREDVQNGVSLIPFAETEKSLGSLNTTTVARLLAAASDITLVIDAQGTITDVSASTDTLPHPENWIGSKWLDTVTVESRVKIEELMKEARGGETARARQVNHRITGQPDLPVRYAVVSLGKSRFAALGTELRPLAQLQQRLVEAQRSTETEFLRLRSAETRFRILFQTAAEAVIMADANTLKTIDVNPAAAALVEMTSGKMIGRAIGEIFEGETRASIEPQLIALRNIGRIESLRVRLSNRRECWLSATLIRQDDTAQMLIRLTPLSDGASSGLPLGKLQMLRALEGMPDAMILIDQNRCIVDANSAFLEMAQISALPQAKGQAVERWLGSSGVDLNVLFANLREHGTMRHFSTLLRTDFGHAEDVEISGICMQDGDSPRYALMLRAQTRPTRANHGIGSDTARNAEQLAELVGRVALKDLVRETTEITEKLCIEAALKLTGDNRAAAAQMLGLSRQSLYGKLRRYGIGDLSDPEDGEDTPE